MGFLRRLLGGRPEGGGEDHAPAGPGDEGRAPAGPGDETIQVKGPSAGGPPDADEAARERELLRADAERLDDNLLQRQLRYADRSWTPPRQGGERRADDAEGAAER